MTCRNDRAGAHYKSFDRKRLIVSSRIEQLLSPISLTEKGGKMMNIENSYLSLKASREEAPASDSSQQNPS